MTAQGMRTARAPRSTGFLSCPELSPQSNLSAHQSTLCSLLESGLSRFHKTLKLAPVIGGERKALDALTCPSFSPARMPSPQVAVWAGGQHWPQGGVPRGEVPAPFVWLQQGLGLLLTTPNALSPPDSILSAEAGAPLVEVGSASCHGPKLSLRWAAGLSCCTSER